MSMNSGFQPHRSKNLSLTWGTLYGYPEKSIIPKREAEPLSHKDSLQNSSG